MCSYGIIVTKKRILMIAGPNGAGKTTIASEIVLPGLNLFEFINADNIAKGLAPFRPESMAITASKLMVKRLRELLLKNLSFAFETTAAGKNYAKYLKLAKTKGYEINLMFLWLSSPDQAITRVRKRVEQGGHSIPEETIFRRYYSGLENLLMLYLPLVDRALIMDNSSKENSVIARKIQSRPLEVFQRPQWNMLTSGRET